MNSMIYAGTTLRDKGYDGAFVSGNRRIEATEIDIAIRRGGRVKEILVGEGDFISAGQVLAHMQM